MSPSQAETERLLREAIKIIHANSRNLNKEWLARARAHVAKLP